LTSTRLRCGIVGYGPVFDWGRMHGRWLQAVPEMQLVAICDRDPERAALAAGDFPGVDTYTDLTTMLGRDDLDLIAIVTPHNTHAALAIQCLQAGKHTVVEKPMCVTIAEADAMVAVAQQAGRTLAVYHNRRHDGNVRLIHQLVRSGAVGEVFHIEVCAMGHSPDATYRHPGDPWRASKAISGGGLYDWGAHAVDWVLSLIDSPLADVTGFFYRFGGDTASNEDHTRAIIRFANGCAAEICHSRAALIGKPYLWYVLGTGGAIIDSGAGAITGYCQEINGPSGGSLTLRTPAGEQTLPYLESDWAHYYQELADHLLRGAPVPVSAAHGRRVISVLQTAEQSSAAGHSLPLPYP
jgi:scyllo-inositol 2-dehydrogenase (NADP+)